MARFKKGILGKFSGTVGTVVGATWKGISYMRSQGDNGSKTPTQKQSEQRAKFALVMKLLRPIAGFLSKTFKSFAVKMSGFNNAVSYALKNAIVGSFPGYSIDYSLLLLSRGDLPNAVNPSAAAIGNGGIKFTWTDNSNTGMAKASDKTLLIAYCPDLHQFLYTEGTSIRGDGTESLNASLFTGKAVETYIGFMSENEKEISNSVFTGEIVVG
jgi:hypothetical protein